MLLWRHVHNRVICLWINVKAIDIMHDMFCIMCYAVYNMNEHSKVFKYILLSLHCKFKKFKKTLYILCLLLKKLGFFCFASLHVDQSYYYITTSFSGMKACWLTMTGETHISKSLWLKIIFPDNELSNAGIKVPLIQVIITGDYKRSNSWVKSEQVICLSSDGCISYMIIVYNSSESATIYLLTLYQHINSERISCEWQMWYTKANVRHYFTLKSYTAYTFVNVSHSIILICLL